MVPFAENRLRFTGSSSDLDGSPGTSREGRFTGVPSH